MKVLVAYFTQSGNTEKIAKALFDGIESDDKEISLVKEVDFTKINDYDLVFLGSPIIANGFAGLYKKIIKGLPELTTRIVLFCTHAAPKNYPQFWEVGFKKFGKKLEKKGGNILGYFDSQGEQAPQVKELIKKADPEYAAIARKASDGHPNEEDIAAAKKFASEIIKKVTV
ncbi:MAG: flavodoxin family protein [Candidatus Helarchaeota archaeon]|nr:flavodoxin family protein [Candidatus Helarchaeota archaeon]